MKEKLYPELLSANKINEMRIELWHVINTLSTERLLQLMGMLNCYAFSIASRWGAIECVEDDQSKKWKCVKNRLLELASACLKGLGEVTTTVLYMQDYLKKFWHGACNSCPSIRKMRQFMKDALGLFDFTPQEKGKTVEPPTILNVDFVRLLVAFEACESEYLSRCDVADGDVVGSELEQFMPKHKAALMVHMFNAVLKGIAKYRRNETTDTSVELPDVESAPDHKVVWKWKNTFAIAYQIWENLAKKYKQQNNAVDWDAQFDSEQWLKMQMELEIPY